MSYTLFRSLVVAFAMLASAFTAHASCYDCSPQCVPAARKWSGVDVPRVEYARDIPNAVRNDRRFKVHSEPKAPSYGVILDLGKVAHAIAVTSVKSVGKKTYELQVAHSNADCKCTTERVTAKFSGGKLSFASGILKGKSFSKVVFITNAKS